jgi:hypothetical protein
VQDYYSESEEEISKFSSPESYSFEFEEEKPSPSASPNRRIIFREPIIPESYRSREVYIIPPQLSMLSANARYTQFINDKVLDRLKNVEEIELNIEWNTPENAELISWLR